MKIYVADDVWDVENPEIVGVFESRERAKIELTKRGIHLDDILVFEYEMNEVYERGQLFCPSVWLKDL